MTVQPQPKAAFSVGDLQELAALLEMRAVPFKGMSLEMLDGFLSALVVGPDLVMPSEWTPPVWGGRPPNWESIEEASRVNGLLMALWNDVTRRVALDPDTLRERDLPLIALPEQFEVEPGEDGNYGADWATGFVDGVKQCGAPRISGSIRCWWASRRSRRANGWRPSLARSPNRFPPAIGSN
jgi:uncharacterized protein